MAASTGKKVEGTGDPRILAIVKVVKGHWEAGRRYSRGMRGMTSTRMHTEYRQFQAEPGYSPAGAIVGAS